MNGTDIGGALREAMWLMLLLGGPVLLASLLVGLAVSLFQAVTQVNEPTLAFVPKVIVVGASLFLMGPFMSAQLTAYARGVMDRLVVIGGQ